MEAHRIGVISDTHGILRPEAAEILKSCEIILHAGDIGKPEILTQLKAIADTYAVLGNVDQLLAEQFRVSADGMPESPAEKRSGEPAEKHSGVPMEELETELFGFRIYMIHNRKMIRKDLSRVDIVVYGHSHKYEVITRDNITWLNPGSCGPKRFRLPVTMMILTLYPEEHRLETEKIDCLSAHVQISKDTSDKVVCAGGSESVRLGVAPETAEEMAIPEQDMYRLVREIMREIDAGKKISHIAVRHHIDERFAEQVCRMYVTHPGVDVDGILDRIERKNL